MKTQTLKQQKIEYIVCKDRFPDDGDRVAIITNRGNKAIAVFARIGGYKLWETDFDFEKEESVIAWSKL